jgi:hypothetical protein
MDRLQQTLWLEWSGLPAALNRLRANGWLVFKKLVELDCQAGRRPGMFECPLAELAERCGLAPGTLEKIVLALRRKKYIRCFLPDNHAEPALFEIRTPIQTPEPPEAVARRLTDPHLRDPTVYRYAVPAETAATDERKIQEVIDYYLNHLSQKINSFVLDEIEIAARRFPIEAIRQMIDRGARHEIRTMSWVLRQLIRDHEKAEVRKKARAGA